MIRLYFLVPTIESTTQIISELKQLSVAEEHIHIVGKDHDRLVLEHLPEAGMAEKTDLLPALKRGLIYGGSTGLLAGIAAVTFPPAGLVLGGAAILGMGAAGAGFGAWISGMIGISVEDKGVAHFEKQLEQGDFLMLVDVDKYDFDAVESAIKSHHPEATVEWVDLKSRSVEYAVSFKH
ncbi:MAG: DUF1269 domain-containing protein [Gammaproteobacteria bacterium]|nr:DUF1269 domain-containing protein [Gammaproteobacteria bacterium]